MSEQRADEEHSFAEWLRQAAPYIRAHRGRTFVIAFGGEILVSDGRTELIHDVALLHTLGIRVVLVAGSRPQIERRLQERGHQTQLYRGLRVTDSEALTAVKEAAGENRVELERLLTMALPGSPMAGARVRVAAGNFVTARPVGVIDGVDYQHTGRVRRIDAGAIRQRLDDDAIVILTPLGYSLTGETFNLSTPELASATAIALGADKLVSLVEGPGLEANELTVAEVSEVVEVAKVGGNGDLRQHLEAAARAVEGGVRRAHILRRRDDAALLRELFTRRGIGTLISQARAEEVRHAAPSDVAGLLTLLEPLEAAGQLVHRPREVVERDLGEFLVIAKDEVVLACAALRRFADGDGELACLAVAAEHRVAGRGDRMVDAIVALAKRLKLKRLFVLTTQSVHWFVERGFETVDSGTLPSSRVYDRKRSAKVLMRLIH